jgi:hypothetical protein
MPLRAPAGATDARNVAAAGFQATGPEIADGPTQGPKATSLCGTPGGRDDGLKNGVRIGLMAGCTSCSEGADGELRL